MAEYVIESYSDKAIVVRGNTKQWRESLKEIGGKWNPNLTGGAGWIFPKTKKDVVEAVFTKVRAPSILQDIESHLETLTKSQKLQFLSDVAKLASK